MIRGGRALGVDGSKGRGVRGVDGVVGLVIYGHLWDLCDGVLRSGRGWLVFLM